jgi:hypothetical protein
MPYNHTEKKSIIMALDNVILENKKNYAFTFFVVMFFTIMLVIFFWH